MAQEGASFKPTLGLLDATMIVAGSMIGSGIFIVSSDIARNVGSAGWLIFVWLLTGFMTLIAALSYGELSAMYPKAGGQYVYLKEAYNPLIGFLYGWSFFAVIQTGTIAAVGVAFSKFAAYIFPSLSEKNILLDFGYIQISSAQLVAILVVVLLSYINTRGVKEGKLIQTTFTLAKLLALFGLIVFGFILGAKAGIWEANWSDAWSFGKLAKTEAGNDLVFVGETVQKTFYENWPAIIGALSAAMVGSVFSSDAWNNVTFIAGEIKRPEKNIGLSLFFGTLIVTVIYVCANLMYTAVLPLNDIAFAQDDRVAVAASQNIFGSVGTIVIALMIMVSTFGCNNGLILSGARVYYTMAKDGLFFQSVGNLNKNGVPAKGLWIQCAWASVLCLSGKYGDLLDYVVFVVLIFYVLTIIGIFKLRRSQPNAVRPYKAFGYPILPACYILLATAMCFALLFTKPKFASFGLLIVLIGIPIYYIAVAGKKK
ncbi:APC family permease [Flavihumibacter sp. UBA7668]|uniref:APC family permease n=1 Tax=Flavihumibacter sp. UBA7668 TaxID=1946542 RepID=UPI0025BEAF73|nr:amino acid permease [Flavihumibacter sp. UBA7668]